MTTFTDRPRGPESAAVVTRREGTDRVLQLACAWCGPAAVVGSILGMVVISGFIPARSPAASGPAIAQWYADHATGIRLGMVISMIAFTLFVPFGIAIALQTRRIENRPVLTYIQIACVAIASLEGIISCCVWVTAAFRPVGIDPNITRALNDLGWLAFLLDVPPFTVWLGAIGIAVLRDTRTEPVFPRWLGYANLWVAALVCPALAIPFFKTGPLAYNGLIALYVPFGCFFIWMVVSSPCLIRAINSEAREGAHGKAVTHVQR